MGTLIALPVLALGILPAVVVANAHVGHPFHLVGKADAPGSSGSLPQAPPRATEDVNATGKALGVEIVKPACNLRQAEPPVRGSLLSHELELGKDGGREQVWEFALEADCSYALWDSHHTAKCLRGNWIVIIGASQTNIWTMQLANTLAPGALLTKRDNYSIDGVFTQLIDVIIRDGKVLYKNIQTDNSTERIGAHTKERDGEVLPAVFAQVLDAPGFTGDEVRITNFFAEYWDNVDLAMDVVESASKWAKAEVSVAVTIGLWYVNSLHCGAQNGWCATRPDYGELSLNELLAQFKSDMEPTIAKMEDFCSPKGRAGVRGCAVATIDHCQFMQGEIWHKIYDAIIHGMQGRSSSTFRLIDLWTLTLQIPEDCIGGHQSPMSAIWTWQILLGGLCPAEDAADGALAIFEGDTCRSTQVHNKCPHPHKAGFHYTWECGLSELCELKAVRPPASLHPIIIAEGSVQIDLGAASASEDTSWLAEYDRACDGYRWVIALATVAVAAMIVVIRNRCQSKEQPDKALSKQYTPVDSSPKLSPTEANGHKNPDVENRESNRDLGGERTTEKLLSTDAKSPEAVVSKPPPADKFSFGLARCVASMHVVAGHLYAKRAIADLYIFSWGFTWVPWFFMLSGFILFSAEARNSRQESALEYVNRRSVTIYPLYAVSLLPAFAIEKMKCEAPAAYVLVLQAWLGQAWVPNVTEQALQMQCWFLSCLVVYWFAFKPLFKFVSLLPLGLVLGVMLTLYSLPWLIVVVPLLLGYDVQWYNEHTFGHTETAIDLLVVFLKFHPVCYLHVFLLGMLLSRARILIGARHGGNRCLQVAMESLAPLGYVGLGLLFAVKELRLPAAKLSARLSVLLPLQSSILLGLAGIPGQELPLVARLAGYLNFLESYSYAVYVMQFICWHLWPRKEVGIGFFIFLAASAVVVVHTIQKPSEALWRRFMRFIWVVPLLVSLLLAGASFLPNPDCQAGIPPILRLDDRLVDVRLPIQARSPDSGVLINPSLLFRGDEVVIAARRHRRSSERTRGAYNGSSVVVLQETWHSEIVVGRVNLDWTDWDRWLASGEPPEFPDLADWSGLRTESGHRWAHLCVRETWVPENSTLMRLVVTGPEDPKVFQLVSPKAGQAVRVAFSSYPPLGRYGCDKDGAVPQMYLASGVHSQSPSAAATAVELKCGSGKRAEKNWIPFNKNGDMYFVYSVLPHVVVEVKSDGTCGARHYSNFAPLVRLQANEPGLAFRGSAQALLINDPEATPNLPKPHYLALLHIVDPRNHSYAHFAYRFSTTPPFDILQVSSQLELRTLQAEEHGPGFAYVSSLAVRDRQVVISYAAGDREARALMLTLWRLDTMFKDPAKDQEEEVGHTAAVQTK